MRPVFGPKQNMDKWLKLAEMTEMTKMTAKTEIGNIFLEPKFKGSVWEMTGILISLLFGIFSSFPIYFCDAICYFLAIILMGTYGTRKCWEGIIKLMFLPNSSQGRED